MRSGFDCVGVKMCATLWCASTIRCCSSGERAEVHPGLYSSRSLCVNIRSGCNATPQHPASSYFWEAKKSCVPGGYSFVCCGRRMLLVFGPLVWWPVVWWVVLRMCLLV